MRSLAGLKQRISNIKKQRQEYKAMKFVYCKTDKNGNKVYTDGKTDKVIDIEPLKNDQSINLFIVEFVNFSTTPKAIA